MFVPLSPTCIALQGAEEEGAKMHDTIASLICKCQGLEGLHAASEHFSRGKDPGAFAKALAEASKEADSSEKELMLTRAVLQVSYHIQSVMWSS